jgi:hypothetical protein
MHKLQGIPIAFFGENLCRIAAINALFVENKLDWQARINSMIYCQRFIHIACKPNR